MIMTLMSLVIEKFVAMRRMTLTGLWVLLVLR